MDLDEKEYSIMETLRFYRDVWSNDFLINLLDFVLRCFFFRKEMLKRSFEESSDGIQDN